VECFVSLTKRAFARASSGLLIAGTGILLLNTSSVIAATVGVSVTDSPQNNIASIFGQASYLPLIAATQIPLSINSQEDIAKIRAANANLVYPGMTSPNYIGLDGVGEIPKVQTGITDPFSLDLSNAAIYQALSNSGISFDKYGDLNPILSAKQEQALITAAAGL